MLTKNSVCRIKGSEALLRIVAILDKPDRAYVEWITTECRHPIIRQYDWMPLHCLVRTDNVWEDRD